MIQIDDHFKTVEPEAKGVYIPPAPGGYCFMVLESSLGLTRDTNKNMLTMALDIVDGDHAGAFEKYPKKYRQLLDKDSLGQFKKMLADFKASNGEARMSGVLTQSLQFDESKLVKCLIGGCLREEEYVNKSGEVKVGLEIAYLCPLAELPNVKPLPLKKLPAGAQRPANGATPAGVYNGAHPQELEKLPF